MQQHTLKYNSGSRKSSRRVGRGDGSGRGSFSGRGVKGQGSRSGARKRPRFEGGQMPFVQKMPKLKGFKNPNRVAFQVVNVTALNTLANDSVVDFTFLYEHKLIFRKNKPVKILGTGDLDKKLTVKVDAVSKSAREKIEKAGGSVETGKVKVAEK